jgi:hypothetical protein
LPAAHPGKLQLRQMNSSAKLLSSMHKQRF